MTLPGRQDPCPCGSGRKYKDCCAQGEEARLAAIASAKIRESAIAKLLAFAFQPAFDNDHSVAETVFWGNLIGNATADELQWLMDSEDSTIKYNAWFLFDWDADGEGTVADFFLEDETVRLSPAEREFLQRLTAAHLALYEVEAVHRGRGLRVRSLWTGERMYVIERTASAQIVTWDLLGARVAPDGLGGKVFEGGLYLYPAEAKDQIVTQFRRLHRRHRRQFPMDSAAPFFRRHGMVFHHLWLSLVAFPQPPQVTTTDGDPFIFCRAVFDTQDAEKVRTAIRSQPNVRIVDEGHLQWTQPAEDGEIVLGTWIVEAQRVAFETTSQERAARGRAWLEALVGDAIRYRATALETIEQAMEDLRTQRPMKVLQFEPEVADAAVQDLYDRHYHDWLDRPVPALGNRTPRSAAGTKLWRPRVAELLKRIENATERAALAGRHPYDFQWIWKELGLERP